MSSFHNHQNSAGQLRFIGIGLSNHADVFKTLPTQARHKSGDARHSWVTHSLIFLGFTADIDMTRSWDDPVNAKHFKSLMPAVLNPEFRTAPTRGENGYGLNHYAGNSRILDSEQRVSMNESKDGSSTILIGEVNSNFVPWGHPNSSRDPANGIQQPDGFGGADAGGANFSMLDGSVQFVSKDVDARVLEQMAAP